MPLTLPPRVATAIAFSTNSAPMWSSVETRCDASTAEVLDVGEIETGFVGRNVGDVAAGPSSWFADSEVALDEVG